MQPYIIFSRTLVEHIKETISSLSFCYVWSVTVQVPEEYRSPARYNFKNYLIKVSKDTHEHLKITIVGDVEPYKNHNICSINIHKNIPVITADDSTLMTDEHVQAIQTIGKELYGHLYGVYREV